MSMSHSICNKPSRGCQSASFRLTLSLKTRSRSTHDHVVKVINTIYNLSYTSFNFPHLIDITPPITTPKLLRSAITARTLIMPCRPSKNPTLQQITAPRIPTHENHSLNYCLILCASRPVPKLAYNSLIGSGYLYLFISECQGPCGSISVVRSQHLPRRHNSPNKGLPTLARLPVRTAHAATVKCPPRTGAKPNHLRARSCHPTHIAAQFGAL